MIKVITEDDNALSRAVNEMSARDLATQTIVELLQKQRELIDKVADFEDLDTLTGCVNLLADTVYSNHKK